MVKFYPKSAKYAEQNVVHGLRCNRCGFTVLKETEPELKKEYPYQCVMCDENLFGIETHQSYDAMSSNEYGSLINAIANTLFEEEGVQAV